MAIASRFWVPATTTIAANPAAVHFVTGNTIVNSTNPTSSVQALAAYEAAGLPTKNVVSATSGGSIAASGWPTTILGNGFVGAHLFAGVGETNFVGGAGEQYLMARQAADVLLSRHWRWRRPDGFDAQAKDVINLSGIDANLAAPRPAGTSTFIGSAHSAAPALRCVIN